MDKENNNNTLHPMVADLVREVDRRTVGGVKIPERTNLDRFIGTPERKRPMKWIPPLDHNE